MSLKSRIVSGQELMLMLLTVWFGRLLMAFLTKRYFINVSPPHFLAVFPHEQLIGNYQDNDLLVYFRLHLLNLMFLYWLQNCRLSQWIQNCLNWSELSTCLLFSSFVLCCLPQTCTWTTLVGQSMCIANNVLLFTNLAQVQYKANCIGRILGKVERLYQVVKTKIAYFKNELLKCWPLQWSQNTDFWCCKYLNYQLCEGERI